MRISVQSYCIPEAHLYCTSLYLYDYICSCYISALHIAVFALWNVMPHRGITDLFTAEAWQALHRTNTSNTQ